jgi:hypothetical protein
MTTAEGDRFRTALTVERNADQLDAYSRYVTSIASPTCVETPVRFYAGSKKATSGPASSAVNISTRNGLARCRGLHFADGARKHWTVILVTFNRRPATCSAAPHDAGRTITCQRLLGSTPRSLASQDQLVSFRSSSGVL